MKSLAVCCAIAFSLAAARAHGDDEIEPLPAPGPAAPVETPPAATVTAPPPPPEAVTLVAPVSVAPAAPGCPRCSVRPVPRGDGAMVWLGGAGGVGIVGPLTAGLSLGGGAYFAAGFESRLGWSVRAEISAVEFTAAGFGASDFRDGVAHAVHYGLIPIVLVGRYTLLRDARVRPIIDLGAGAEFPTFDIDTGHVADHPIVAPVAVVAIGGEYDLDRSRTLELGLRFSYSFNARPWRAVLDSPDVAPDVASRADPGTGALILFAGLACCHGSLGPSAPRIF